MNFVTPEKFQKDSIKIPERFHKNSIEEGIESTF